MKTFQSVFLIHSCCDGKVEWNIRKRITFRLMQYRRVRFMTQPLKPASRLGTDKSKGKKEGKKKSERASSLKGDPRRRRRVPHAHTLGRVHKSWAEPRSSSSITRQNTHNRSAGARWQFLRTLYVYKQHRWPP